VTSAEAKAWIIRQILAEAAFDKVPLDPLEQRMLEYSETAGTPPDLVELNEAFDRKHNQDDYEQKIASIIRRLLANLNADGPDALTPWYEAVRAISNEDHYLMVMVNQANAAPKGQRQPFDRTRLVLTAAGILLFAVLVFALTQHFR
jgi:hypothetical protein